MKGEPRQEGTGRGGRWEEMEDEEEGTKVRGGGGAWPGLCYCGAEIQWTRVKSPALAMVSLS